MSKLDDALAKHTRMIMGGRVSEWEAKIMAKADIKKAIIEIIDKHDNEIWVDTYDAIVKEINEL